MTEDRAIEHARYSSHNSRSHEEIPSRTSRRRKAARKPRRILNLWARLTLLGVAVVVLILAAVGLVAKVIRPYREAGTQARQLAQTQHQVAALDAQNADLRRRIALLNTNSGIVTEARGMGYLKPGEIPFVVENTDSQENGKADILPPALAPTSPKTHSRLHGLLRRLTGRSF